MGKNKACWNKNENLNLYTTSDGVNSVIEEMSTSEFVEGVKLDDIIGDLDGVDIIKLDVEWAEAEVLEGAANILKKFHPKIVFEAIREEDLDKIINVLNPYKYNICRITEYDYLAY